MSEAEQLLAAGLVWTLIVLNALHPVRRCSVLVIPSFFAAWLPVEAPLHCLLLLVATLAGPLAAGGLDAWVGWLGLGGGLAALAGLLFLHRQGVHSAQAVEPLLDAAGLAATEAAERLPSHRLKRQLLLFWFAEDGVEVVRDIPYWPGGDRRHRLDIYRPPGARASAPVLVQVHGGGWVTGRKSQQALPLMYSLAAAGWLCVSVNYRLSPRARWPDHLVDLKRALAWVKREVGAYGGDPDRVLITGGSAGGHLAAMAALTAGQARWQPGFEQADTSVDAAVICYGVYDLADRQRLWCYRGWRWYLRRWVLPRRLTDVEGALAEASPQSWLGPDAPPLMVVHGRNDGMICCRQARGFVHSLRQAGARTVVYLELPYAQHAFDLFHSPRCHALIRAVYRFAEQQRREIHRAGKSA